MKKTHEKTKKGLSDIRAGKTDSRDDMKKEMKKARCRSEIC